MTRILIALAALTLLAALVTLVGRARFRAQVSGEVRTLFSGTLPRVSAEQLRARVDALPEPVRRYLHYAIDSNAPAIATARLRHGGRFRTSPDARWWAITGEQYFTVARPGFVWTATVRPIPIAWIDARDLLIGGRGNMLVKAFSMVTLANASGPEIDQGARLRWLAECAWFPYAYASDALEWEAIDAQSARVMLRQPALPVSAILEVDQDGRLTRLRAERYRDIGGGKAVLTPWSGTYAEYREFNGLRVPTAVDVAWHLDTGTFSYARFTVTTIEYDARTRF